MNDHTPNTDPTVPSNSVPPVSSGMVGQGSHLLQTGMMLPPQSPGVLGVIGKYQVIKILGEGGMGQVLLAREPVTDSMVAIKLIKPEFLNKQWAVHRFLTEARHMFRMSHGSIIRVLDVSDRPEGPYFVMPFMSGGSLADKIKPGEPMDPEAILPVAHAVAEALQHAHTRGITHRDLKPSNILLDSEGKAQLADFGLLRTFLNDTIIDASQPQMEGTVPYMSPAVAAGKAEDTRCDIYAFGCLLYEMLTGQPPYQGPTADAVLKQIQDGPPPPIRQLNPQAPTALTAIADHAMARELRDRYASMADVVAELERVAQGKEPIGTHGKVVAKPRNRKALIAAGAVVLVGLAAFGISRLDWKHEDKPPIVQAAPKPLQNDKGSPETRVEGDFTYTVKDDAVTIVKYTGSEADVTIPDIIQKMPVTDIRPYAFAGCINMANITIPGSVTRIHDDAFNDCTGLTSITIPRSVTFIGTVAFRNCSALARINVDVANPIYSSDKDGVVFNKEKTQIVCYPPGKIGAYVIPDRVTSIGSNAFTNSFRSLTNVTIPNSVTDIGAGAFGNCLQLTRMEIPASVKSIGKAPFKYCTGLTSIAVDSANPVFSSSADGVLFDKQKTCLLSYPCGRGGSYEIPDGVANIADSAFHGCTKLTRVTMPASITTIGIDAFCRCDELTAVNFKGNAPSLGVGAFQKVTKATIYHLPTTTGWGKEFGGRPTKVWDPEKDAKPSLSQTTDATPAPLTEGPFSYTVKDGAVTIVKYTGPGGNVVIPDKIKGQPVTSIGDEAFKRCAVVTSVTLPESITRIGVSAFNRCSGLTRATLPNSVTHLGAAAFIYCHSLSSMTIPDRVTDIPERLFEGCSRLTDITFRGHITSIGDYALFGTKLSKVTIPESVTNIGSWAFAGCPNLTGITIPPGVKTMGYAPFHSCERLISITVDAANPAFSSSKDGILFNKEKTILINYLGGKAGSYVIPSSVTDINGWAFSGCGGLTGVTIPASITAIGNPFASCGTLTSILVDAASPAYSSVDGILFNKEKSGIVLYPPGRAGNYVIPDGVTKISQSAFEQCVSLTDVTIPENLTVVETNAFGGCRNLTGIYFRGNPPRLGNDILKGVNEKATVYYLPTTKGWGKEFGGRPTAVWDPKAGMPQAPSATPGVPGMRVPGPRPILQPGIVPPAPGGATSTASAAGPFTITTHNNAVTISKYTGQGGDLVIPDKINALPVTSIGDNAFGGCTKLTGVTIPNSVTTIGDHAFAGCTNLTDIRMQDGVTTINGWAFTGSTGLKSITIPASVRSISGHAFGYCSGLTSIIVDGANATYSSGTDGHLYDKGKTSLVSFAGGQKGDFTIPNNVTSIGDAAFAGCAGLTAITIPPSVKRIGSLAFWECSGLAQITIPNGVTHIGISAFSACPKLTRVTLPASVTSMDGNPWRFCGNLTSITVDAANTAFSSSEDGVLFNKDKTVLRSCPNAKSGSYEIPENVTAVGECAFRGCDKLTRVTAPAGLKSLGGHAFAVCSNLEEFYFKGDAPKLTGTLDFYLVKNATICHLPTAKGWGKEFGGRPTAVWEPKAKAEN